MIYFGIDLGERKIGVAKGKSLDEPVFTVGVYVGKGIQFVVREILKEAYGEEFGLVFGIPLEEDGRIGLQGRKILKVVGKFLEEVRRARLAGPPGGERKVGNERGGEGEKLVEGEKNVWFVDESFSSFEALELKKEMLKIGVSVGEDDDLAAMKILDRFFKGVGIIKDVMKS